jgi:hypothetical protein
MGLRDYKRRVKPEKFSYVPELIQERYHSSEPDPIVNMAVCHKLVYDKVDYHHSGSKIHRPDTMLDRLSGDCQDHGVLLATLFKACGLDASIIRVKSSTDYHILTEVKDPLNNINETSESLRRFYWEEFDRFPREIAYDKHGSQHWLIADTAGDENSGWSEYVGDITEHIGDSAKQRTDSSWSWRKLDGRIEV